MNSAKRRRCRPSRSLSRATAVYIRHRGSLQEVRLPVSQIRNFMKFQSSKLLRSLEISSNPSSQRFFVFQGISAASASASSSSSSRINSLCPPSISQSSARKLSTSIQPNIQGRKGRCFRGTMGHQRVQRVQVSDPWNRSPSLGSTWSPCKLTWGDHWQTMGPGSECDP